MKIVIAMDSFKGSLTAPQACEAVRRGFAAAGVTSAHLIPMADGGEGTAECLASACNGQLIRESVPALFGVEKSCAYALIDDGDTAVIETAMAAGIADLRPEERDVLRASTYGVGVQIRNAVARGCKKIIVGLGGSATTDGALGALQALGVAFYDNEDRLLPLGAGGGMLQKIVRADASEMISCPAQIVYACDVTNPLYGERGAAYVYGPQKGADPETVEFLDRGLRNFARVLADCFGRDISLVPGSGAAGGLCGGLLCALGGTVQSGFDILSASAGLEAKIANADLVITGEGKTDRQTAFGKLPCKVGELGKKHGVPVICLSGSVDRSSSELYEHGVTALFDTVPAPRTLEQVMSDAEASLLFTAQNVARALVSVK